MFQFRRFSPPPPNSHLCCVEITNSGTWQLVNLVESYRRFAGIFCRRHQGIIFRQHAPFHQTTRSCRVTDAKTSGLVSLIFLFFYYFFSWLDSPWRGCRVMLRFRDSHSDKPQTVALRTIDQPDAETSTWQHKTIKTDIYAPGDIRTRNLNKWTAADPCRRTRGHRDRPIFIITTVKLSDSKLSCVHIMRKIRIATEK